LRRSLPELPAVRRERLARQYGIPDYDASVLAADRALADFFEAVAQRCETGKTASNWIMTDVLRLVAAHETPVTACALTPEALVELIGLVEAQTINALTAKELLEEAFLSGGSPAAQVRVRGLAQVSDSGALDGWVDAVVQANPKTVADWKAGKLAVVSFLIGQVMKLSKGKADPKVVGRLVGERLAQLNG
jgi:aspartyl-tRNA(Asn)/glutamyl-tRNA(Gln) amidotransferase subunit B